MLRPDVCDLNSGLDDLHDATADFMDRPSDELLRVGSGLYFERVGPGAHGGHHRSCEHGQRDMMVPAVPLISFQIMVAHRFRILKKTQM